jgi:hypothetical protein
MWCYANFLYMMIWIIEIHYILRYLSLLFFMLTGENLSPYSHKAYAKEATTSTELLVKH